MRKVVHYPSTQKPPASGRRPVLRLTQRDVQATTDELVWFHHLFHIVFQRREQREWSLFYLCGQLESILKRHPIDDESIRQVPQGFPVFSFVLPAGT